MPTAKSPELSRLKQQVLLSWVVGKYVHLTRTQDNYKALCPFHKEKTPSFIIRDAIQSFHCFGCGVSGDVFDFLQHMEGCSLERATAILESLLGLPSLPIKEEKLTSCTDEFLTLTQSLALHFQKNLEAKPEVIDYLLKRKATNYKDFQLGYIDKDAEQVFQNIKDYFSEDIITKSSLFPKGRFFAHSAISIPIKDQFGNIVSFCAHNPKNKAFRYIFSKTNNWFRKSDLLFGLSHLRPLKEKRIVFVEGFFDAISLQALRHPAVALMGTSLSSVAAKAASRYKTQILMLDSDDAGRTASYKNLGQIFAHLQPEHTVCIANPAPYKDANELLTQNPDEITNKLLSAKHLANFLYDEAKKVVGIRSPTYMEPSRTLRLKKELSSFYKQSPHEEMRTEYRQFYNKLIFYESIRKPLPQLNAEIKPNCPAQNIVSSALASLVASDPSLLETPHLEELMPYAFRALETKRYDTSAEIPLKRKNKEVFLEILLLEMFILNNQAKPNYVRAAKMRQTDLRELLNKK